MAELSKPFWVKQRQADPGAVLDIMARYYSDASDADTIPTNCDTANLTVNITANDSTTRCGGSFDSDGLVTLNLTDSAAAAVNGVGIHVTVMGRAKNTNAGVLPSNIPF